MKLDRATIHEEIARAKTRFGPVPQLAPDEWRSTDCEAWLRKESLAGFHQEVERNEDLCDPCGDLIGRDELERYAPEYAAGSRCLGCLPEMDSALEVDEVLDFHATEPVSVSRVHHSQEPIMISSPKKITTPKANGKTKRFGRTPVRPELMAPGLTSTVTPGGIAANDPEAQPPPEIATVPEVEQVIAIETDQIDANPFQPRKNFSQTELAGLADSICAEGQLEPAIVRKIVGGRYQLVAGERRLRACKLAGLPLRAIVRELDDDQTATQALLENLQRADLNPLEQGRAIAALLERDGVTQADLARQLGLDPAEISTRARFALLPEWVQERLGDGRLCASHAKRLLKWIDKVPALSKELLSRHKQAEECPSLEEWEQSITNGLYDLTAPIAKRWYEVGVGAIECTLSPEALAQLTLLEIPKRWGHAEEKTEVRAIDVERANTLLDQAKARAIVAAKSAAGKKKSAKTKGDEKAAPPTKAELAEKAEEQERIYRQRVEQWSHRWLAYLCAKAITTPSESQIDLATAAVDQIVFYLATATWHLGYQDHDRLRRLRERILGKAWREADPFGTALTSTDGSHGLLDRLAEGVLYDLDHEQPLEIVPPPALESLARYLRIDLAEAWSKEQAGEPLTEEFYEIHTKDRLVKLCDELNVSCGSHMGKNELVGCLLNAKPKDLPSVLSPLAKRLLSRDKPAAQGERKRKEASRKDAKARRNAR